MTWISGTPSGHSRHMTTSGTYGNFNFDYHRSYLPYLPKVRKNRILDRHRQHLVTGNEEYGAFYVEPNEYDLYGLRTSRSDPGGHYTPRVKATYRDDVTRSDTYAYEKRKDDVMQRKHESLKLPPLIISDGRNDIIGNIVSPRGEDVLKLPNIKYIDMNFTMNDDTVMHVEAFPHPRYRQAFR